MVQEKVVLLDVSIFYYPRLSYNNCKPKGFSAIAGTVGGGGLGDFAIKKLKH